MTSGRGQHIHRFVAFMIPFSFILRAFILLFQGHRTGTCGLSSPSCLNYQFWWIRHLELWQAVLLREPPTSKGLGISQKMLPSLGTSILVRISMVQCSPCSRKGKSFSKVGPGFLRKIGIGPIQLHHIVEQVLRETASLKVALKSPHNALQIALT